MLFPYFAKFTFDVSPLQFAKLWGEIAGFSRCRSAFTTCQFRNSTFLFCQNAKSTPPYGLPEWASSCPQFLRSECSFWSAFIGLQKITLPLWFLFFSTGCLELLPLFSLFLFIVFFSFFDLMDLWSLRGALSKLKFTPKITFENNDIQKKLKGFDFKFHVFLKSPFLWVMCTWIYPNGIFEAFSHCETLKSLKNT